HGKLEAVFLVDVVFAKIVHSLAQMLDGVGAWTASVGLNAFAPAPEHENPRAKFRAQIHCAHGLLQRVRANFRITGRKSSIAKHRMREKRNCRHGDDESMLLAGFLELANNGIPFGAVCVDWHQVIVVKVDAPSADFSEHGDDVDRRNKRTNKIAKRIAPTVPNGP